MRSCRCHPPQALALITPPFTPGRAPPWLPTLSLSCVGPRPQAGGGGPSTQCLTSSSPRLFSSQTCQQPRAISWLMHSVTVHSSISENEQERRNEWTKILKNFFTARGVKLECLELVQEATPSVAFELLWPCLQQFYTPWDCASPQGTGLVCLVCCWVSWPRIVPGTESVLSEALFNEWTHRWTNEWEGYCNNPGKRQREPELGEWRRNFSLQPLDLQVWGWGEREGGPGQRQVCNLGDCSLQR